MLIEFIPGSEFVTQTTQPPQPAKKYIPQWYKDIPSHHHKNPEFDEFANITNKNVKSCMPFLDALTSGYILTSWCDLFIERKNNEIHYYYSGQPKLVALRDNPSLQLSDSYENLEFTWKKYWAAKLPKGYSLLVTHPFNRYDLPFTTCTGITDTDSFDYVNETGGNVPFYLHKGFEGLIPAGTPIMQFVPIKRENWKSDVAEFDLTRTNKNTASYSAKFKDYYKNNHWNRKEYN